MLTLDPPRVDPFIDNRVRPTSLVHLNIRIRVVLVAKRFFPLKKRFSCNNWLRYAKLIFLGFCLSWRLNDTCVYLNVSVYTIIEPVVLSTFCAICAIDAMIAEAYARNLRLAGLWSPLSLSLLMLDVTGELRIALYKSCIYIYEA